MLFGSGVGSRVTYRVSSVINGGPFGPHTSSVPLNILVRKTFKFNNNEVLIDNAVTEVKIHITSS